MHKANKINPKRGEDESCIGNFFKMFDFYKDLPDSLSEPTLTGASVSLILLTIIGLLLSQTVYSYIQY